MQIVSHSELADALGVSANTLTAYSGEKPPIPILERATRGRQHKYDLAAAIAWWIDRQVRRETAAERSAKGRLYALQAELQAIRNQEIRARLVDADAAKAAWAGFVAHCKAQTGPEAQAVLEAYDQGKASGLGRMELVDLIGARLDALLTQLADYEPAEGNAL